MDDQDSIGNQGRLLKRAVVFSCLAPSGLGVVIAGPPWFNSATMIIGVLTSREVARLVRESGVPIDTRAAMTSFSSLLCKSSRCRVCALAAACVGTPRHPEHQFSVVSSNLVGFVVAAPILSATRLRGSPLGKEWLLWGITTTWLNDAAAYLIGPLVGGKAFPQWISPRKTWTGLLPGWALATASGIAFGRRLGISRSQGWKLGLCVGVAASIGDLTESMLKRASGQRDSGGVLPGYGGLLDRTDSLLAVLPVLARLHRRLVSGERSTRWVRDIRQLQEPDSGSPTRG